MIEYKLQIDQQRKYRVSDNSTNSAEVKKGCNYDQTESCQSYLTLTCVTVLYSERHNQTGETTTINIAVFLLSTTYQGSMLV